MLKSETFYVACQPIGRIGRHAFADEAEVHVTMRSEPREGLEQDGRPFVRAEMTRVQDRTDSVLAIGTRLWIKVLDTVRDEKNSLHSQRFRVFPPKVGEHDGSPTAPVKKRKEFPKEVPSCRPCGARGLKMHNDAPRGEKREGHQQDIADHRCAMRTSAWIDLQIDSAASSQPNESLEDAKQLPELCDAGFPKLIEIF
jgi:hypothetical protein